jgi:acetylornithine deacetylase
VQDVVTANPDSWSFNPFKLTREGDKLLGRGVTDCLGHVALLAELFRQLGEHKPPLKATVMGVFIANEENSMVGGAGASSAACSVGGKGGCKTTFHGNCSPGFLRH